ncbi:MAG: SDR family NAD(P)-dependent oxidoreductase [Azospirillaceae bacterium]
MDIQSQALAGRHALVTGGGRGNGPALARALARAGADGTVARRTHAPRDAVCLETGGRAVTLDVTDARAVADRIETIAAETGPVDILVNNAGAAESAPFARTGEDVWQRMLAINLLAPRHCIAACLPAMIERGWGRIVTIASTAGLKGYAYTTAYSAAKHGVIGLTRALALETARKGVTVNAICPGFADTDIVEESLRRIEKKTGRDRAAALAELTRFNPQGRLIDPDEVAAMVVHLAGDAGRSITGKAIAIDGGETG